MIKLLWRSDVHLSDHTPQSRKDDWTEAVLSNLRQVGKIAARIEAEAVIDGGDYFDVKSPSRNSHRLVRLTAEVHNEYPCPVYACVGNHDCKFGDYGHLPVQPLGVLFETGVFRRLYDEHEVVFEEEGTKVRVVGIPYHGTKYDLTRFSRIKRGDEDHLVVVAHVLASPKGGSMFEGEDIVKYNDLLDLNPDISLYCFGHWHKDQGVQEIDPGRFVVNVGSLTRGSLTQDNLERIPACVELCFEGPTFTHKIHRLHVPPASEVFDVEGKERAEERDTVMETFVESIQATLQSTSERTLEDVIQGLDDVPDKVRERALYYIEQAR